MRNFELENKPPTRLYRKKSTMELAFINDPFEIDTQEGEMSISPETDEMIWPLQVKQI
jgi:hypothetical protein